MKQKTFGNGWAATDKRPSAARWAHRFAEAFIRNSGVPYRPPVPARRYDPSMRNVVVR